MSINDSVFYWTKECKCCFSCKTRSFRDYDKFIEFLESKEYQPRVSWKRKFREDLSKVVSLYWCARRTKKEQKFVTTIPGPGLKCFEQCWFIDKEEDCGKEKI